MSDFKTPQGKLVEEADKHSRRRKAFRDGAVFTLVLGFAGATGYTYKILSDMRNDNWLEFAASNSAVCGVDEKGTVAVVARGPFAIAADNIRYFPHHYGKEDRYESIGVCYYTDRYGKEKAALAKPKNEALLAI